MLRKSVNRYELFDDKDALLESAIIIKSIIDTIIDDGNNTCVNID